MPPPTPTRRRLPKGQGEQLRDELLDAAARLLEERGREERVSVNDVVGAVGVTPPLLYAHFTDKAALFAAVHARRMQEFSERLAAAAAEGTDPMDALERRGRAYVEYALEQPASYAALFLRSHEGINIMTDPAKGPDSAYDELVANIAGCMAVGLMPEDEPDRVARTIWAVVHGLAALLITFPEYAEPYGVDAIVERTLRTLTVGLGGTPAQG